MKPFIDSVELADLCGISRRQATSIIKEVQQDLEKRGVRVLKARPLIAPREEVFRKIGVNNYEDFEKHI